MTKKNLKASHVVFVAILLIFVLLFMLAKTVTKLSSGRSVGSPRHRVDLVKMENIYKAGTKKILDEYQSVYSSTTITQVNQTKDKLLIMTVPAKFRDLHFNLVFAMDQMTDYLNSNDNNKLLLSQQLISQAKKDYSWLN